MKQKTYNQVTCTIFIVVAALHVLRLVLGWDVVFAGWEIPIWFSIVGAIAGGYLAWSAYKLEK